jgi:pimeloyl-ACP methyl ester carboxylesterase
VVLADWRAALDFIETAHGTRPTGWWGLSMGTMMGLPVTATDPRIKVAVLGLMGTWGPNGDDLARLARELICPVRFLVQWDDEIVPRDSCIELFTLLGSAKKTLHGNPGAHQAVPTFEIGGSVDYLSRHLR